MDGRTSLPEANQNRDRETSRGSLIKVCFNWHPQHRSRSQATNFVIGEPKPRSRQRPSRFRVADQILTHIQCLVLHHMRDSVKPPSTMSSFRRETDPPLHPHDSYQPGAYGPQTPTPSAVPSWNHGYPQHAHYPYLTPPTSTSPHPMHHYAPAGPWYYNELPPFPPLHPRPVTPPALHNVRHPLQSGSVMSPGSPSTRKSPSGQQKRKQKENHASPHASPSKKQKIWYPEAPIPDGLKTIFRAIEVSGWSLGQFLCNAFSFDLESSHNRSHSGRVSHFLRGTNKDYTAARILDLWLRHPGGRLKQGHEDLSFMYSTTQPYIKIRSIRPAMTSFAAQLAQRLMVREAEKVVQPENGLHASRTRGKTQKHLVWTDVGASTIPKVAEIIAKHQPFTTACALAIAERPPRKRNGRVVAERTYRPAPMVSTRIYLFRHKKF